MVALAKSMPQSVHHIHFPNESAEYRKARNALLEDEMELRRQVEKVAARRRTLPPGGAVSQDYAFEGQGADGKPATVKFSELFAPGKNALAIYSFMFGPERERPCPGCTHFLDGLDGATRHINQRVNFVVVAKSPLPRLLAFAKERGWRWLRLLSTADSAYARDYFGDSTALPVAVRKQQEFKAGEEWDMPMLNVFRRGQRDPSLLGLRTPLRSARTRTGVSAQRPAGPFVEHVRSSARGPRRFRAEAQLPLAHRDWSHGTADLSRIMDRR